MRYRLPNTTTTTTTTVVTLELQPLPLMAAAATANTTDDDDDGSNNIWNNSPLGSEAWYASALLTCLLLQVVEDDDSSILGPLLLPHNDDNDDDDDNDPFVVLELGSGAVGLSGLACAVALQQQQRRRRRRQWKVVLTDNDPLVLEQLRKNVERNLPNLLLSSANDDDDDNSSSGQQQHILVEHLDWGSNNDPLWKNMHVDLVIGSELVYTQETAQACSDILLRLLRENSNNIQIWIVQVTDRFGWMDFVIPTLEASGTARVQTFQPISAEIHDLAATLIPMGGTLDRHAYGAFCITRKRQE
jgi:hypothetical protein